MKILIVHPNFSTTDIRGSEIIAQNTYEILKSNGHDVYYFATNKEPFLENFYWTKYFPEYHEHFVPKYYWNFEAQKNIANMLDDMKFDIVHIHVTFALTYSIFKPIYERRIPTIMTVHDTGIICPAKFGWDVDKGQICKKCHSINTLPCIFNNCVLTKKRISSFNLALTNFFEKISGYNKRINKFIIPSNALAEYLKNDIQQEKIKIIPNFINNNFIKHTINSLSTAKYFLYVGTLADYKGVNILLDAITKLPKEINFKIIGSGFQENKYRQFLTENNLNNVEILGNIQREDIIRYYQECISLIVPSNYFEIFGMINLEAFICKKPVIGSNIGGIPEIVEHNKTGLLFEPGNAEQLKECILKYWTNPDLVIEHGKNGYQKAITNYTEEKYYKELMKVYEEILSGK